MTPGETILSEVTGGEQDTMTPGEAILSEVTGGDTIPSDLHRNENEESPKEDKSEQKV